MDPEPAIGPTTSVACISGKSFDRGLVPRIEEPELKRRVS